MIETALKREIRPTLKHGDLRINWLLHGPKGTVELVVRIKKEQDPRYPTLPKFDAEPRYVNLHHRSEPDDACCGFEADCDVLDGPCWIDGSLIAAEQFLTKLLDDKDATEESIWAELESWYASRMEGSDG